MLPTSSTMMISPKGFGIVQGQCSTALAARRAGSRERHGTRSEMIVVGLEVAVEAEAPSPGPPHRCHRLSSPASNFAAVVQPPSPQGLAIISPAQSAIAPVMPTRAPGTMQDALDVSP